MNQGFCRLGQGVVEHICVSGGRVGASGNVVGGIEGAFLCVCTCICIHVICVLCVCVSICHVYVCMCACQYVMCMYVCVYVHV